MRNLLEQLTLTPESDSTFLGPASQESHFRAFGGQIVAQALLAAGRTAPEHRPCHSVHGYFLRPGHTNKPMHMEVDRIRDGRSFSMRRVAVQQNDKDIFHLQASFHHAEGGTEHRTTMPGVSGPYELSSFTERFGGRESLDDMGRWFDRVSSFDVRFANASPFDADYSDGDSHHSRVWIRFNEPVPDDQLLHQAIVAYVSDLTILDPILLAHQRRWTENAIIGASLDHAIWFHNEIRATQWLLFDQTSSVAGHGRGMAQAQVWTESGQLVATVAQEALLRAPHGGKDRR